MVLCWTIVVAMGVILYSTRRSRVSSDYVHDFYSCAKFGENPSMGAFCENR